MSMTAGYIVVTKIYAGDRTAKPQTTVSVKTEPKEIAETRRRLKSFKAKFQIGRIRVDA